MAANTVPSTQKETQIQTHLQIYLQPAFCPLSCSWQIVNFPSTERNASRLTQAKGKQKGSEKKGTRKKKDCSSLGSLSSYQEVIASSKCPLTS